MNNLDIDRNQLIDLDHSLSLETLQSNKLGAYSSTTVLGANTRKYHGLFVCPAPEVDDKNHVLLSSLDETVFLKEEAYPLGLHLYPNNVWYPNGNEYAHTYSHTPVPTLVFIVGDVLLKKEVLLLENEARLLIRYTLVEGKAKTKLRLQPFLAFRSIHSLTSENHFANTATEKVPSGVKAKLYEDYPYLFMQTSKKAEFVASASWNKSIEYIEEQKRGYEFFEDLLVPGYFEIDLKKGESIVFAAGLKQTTGKSLTTQFTKAAEKRTAPSNFDDMLKNAAQQFIVKDKSKTNVVAGFPWYGSQARYSLISLPGLTLANGDAKTCEEALDTISKDFCGALLPRNGHGETADYASVDASLWYFWAIQKYAEAGGKTTTIKKKYWTKMKAVLDGFKKGADFDILMEKNGLLWAGHDGIALTWMDAYIGDQPTTPRTGYAVEVNALWYNAIVFALELADEFKDEKFIKAWKKWPAVIEESYVKMFWSEERGYLADFVNNETTDWSVRPNQIFAVSMPNSPISEDMQKAVFAKVEGDLLTKQGIRTLSPKHSNYRGLYQGNHYERELAMHNGTIFTWLLGSFVDAYLNLHGDSKSAYIQNIYSGFEKEILRHGLETISELFDGDQPHHPGGAIAYSASVAELLRIGKLIGEK